MQDRIPVRTILEISIAIMFIASLSAHGYSNYEEFIDNEKLEIETYVNNIETSDNSTEIKTNYTSTTTMPILVYHRIGKTDILPVSNEKKPYKPYNVQQDVFESQMQFIKAEGYTALTMQDLIKAEQNKTLPNKPIAITFDDGWRSQYENALPSLLKYNIPATFYIYTGVIGSNAYMTWDNLHSLVDLKMEIGDHTKNHPRLTKTENSKLDEELLESKHLLEKDLHIEISDFAYPYGNYNQSIINELKKDGYISARTSNKGLHNDFKDLYQLNVLYAPSDLQTLKEMLNDK